jgi:hypothetical protein
MQKLERRNLSLVASLAVAALLAMAGGTAAQSAGEPEEQRQAQEQQQEQQQQSREQSTDETRPAAPVRPAGPHVTGTVVRWTGNRIDLKTPEGKLQKVAVNRDTERLVEIAEGVEVTVEYRRKISDFVIAKRVLAAETGAPAVQPAKGTTAGPKANSVTGKVVSWNNAALLLRTDAGEVTFFLSPSTEYLVKSLDPGLLVTVEYREGADRAKMAARVLAAEAKVEEPVESETGSE